MSLSPPDTSQPPSSPYNTPDPPSGPSHPRDAFTVLRLSARLPLPCASSSFSDDDNNDDDDYEHKGNDDGDGDSNGDDSASNHGLRSRTRIQSLELCFHADFLASAALDDQPVSLHFASPPQPVVLYSVPPSLEPPTPPYYIHEIPDVIDLTTGQSPPRLLRRNIALALCALVFAIIFAALGFLAGCYAGPSADVPAGVPRPTMPTVMASPAGHRYAFSFANDTRPVALHRKILSLQHHRLALQPPLVDALDRVWSLSELEKMVHHLCLNITVHSASADDGDASEAGEGMREIDLVCDHLLRRFHNIVPTWVDLRTAADFDTIPSNLAYAARLLNMSSVDNIGDALRTALFDPGRDPFVAACRLCDPNATSTRFVHDPAMPISPPVWSWHFACSPGFTHTAANDTTTAFLLDWATARSARRFETLRNAPLDVDGTPFYPDNQHPFSEADEVVSVRLPSEAAVFALTRHLVEVAASISTLVSILAEKGVITPLTDATFSDGYKPGEGRGPPLSENRRRRRLQSGVWLPSWLKYRPPKRSEATTAVAIAHGANALLAIRNDTVIPIIRLLGQVTAGISCGCILSADLLRNLDDLERAGLAGRETTETSVRAPVSPVMNAEAATTIELKHVVHTPDPTLEAEALTVASELIRGLIRARPAARMALQMETPDREEVTTASTKARPFIPRNEREAAFLDGIRNGGMLTQPQGLSDMFQGFRDLMENAAWDDDAGGAEG